MSFITSIWNTLICIIGTVGIGCWYILDIIGDLKAENSKCEKKYKEI